MLNSIDSSIVIKASYCILLTAIDKQSSSEITSCTNNDINYAINALITVLERTESGYSRDDIMKDIISILNSVRDKYSICAKLMEHVSSIVDTETRMLIILTLYKTLVKTTLFQRMKLILSNARFTSKDSDIDKLGKEAYIEHCWNSPSDEFEEQLRCEILFCLAREFRLIIPDLGSKESKQAWVQVGMEICQQALSAFMWKASKWQNVCLSEVGRILTKLCIVSRSMDVFPKVNAILEDYLNNYTQMTSEFAQIMTITILSHFLSFESGKEYGEILYSYLITYLNFLKENGTKEKIDIILNALIIFCSRYTIKLKETVEYLKKEKVDESMKASYLRLNYALKYDILNKNSKDKNV
jgi:hypothetical protein